MAGRSALVVVGVAAVAVALVFINRTSGGHQLGGRAPATATVQVTSTVEHWGSFFGSGQGNYGTQAAPVPVTIPGRVIQVASSNSTEYALTGAGQVYAWGLGTVGELGDGGTVNSLKKAMRVRFPAGVKIAWLPTDVMPYDSGLAVDTRGRAWGWGDNGGGEFCLGNTRRHLTPVRLPLPGITALAGASNHVIYDSRGTVYACGQNVRGDLGDGWTANTTTPKKVAGLDGATVTALVASFANSGALLANGDYFDWGYNQSGQLGDGQMRHSSDRPVQVKLSHPVIEVAQGGSIWDNGQTVVKLANGSLWSWGNNRAGQLGNDNTFPRDVPVRFYAPVGVRYKHLASGSATSYAIAGTGDVYAWGVSHVGQLGNGKHKTSLVPVRVARDATLISSTANNVVISVTTAPCRHLRCGAKTDADRG